MNFFKKTTALILVLVLMLTLALGTFCVSAEDNTYKAGDVIFVDFSQMPHWHTGKANVGFETVDSYLYINFTANTRFDSGEKEKITIGENTDRFNPRIVTEEVSEYLYKYTVTEEDAGKDTLRFWRGSAENLWNHSVELKYSDYLSGNNTVVITDYNYEAEGSGYIDSTVFYPYELEADFEISAEKEEKGEPHYIYIALIEIPDVELTYSYKIYVNGELISEEDKAQFVPELNFTTVDVVIEAYFEDGTVAAKFEDSTTLRYADFAYIGSEPDCLYAHAIVDNGTEKESWIKLFKSGDTNVFFLPSSAKENEVEILNTYNYPITIGETEIASGEVKTVSYTAGEIYDVNGADEFTLSFMKSDSEAALFVNNDYSKTESLWDYLCADKSNSTSAAASIVNPDGTVIDTDLKKIKGRGNTTWNADKKPFNLNFDDTVEVGTMQATKQFSLLANFQDAAMCRNRILYDLGDAVGLRYSSDSRFVDFYVDGEYKGQYQMCQKIEAGKKNMIFDVKDDDHLDDDGNLKEQFSMLLEVPYGEDFYTKTESGIDVVIKSPDVEGNDNLYANEVKAYAKKLFDEMYLALKNNSPNLSELIDVESFAKAYLIQELGKNWDTHSWYLTYVPDEEGNYKFYAAPVWDFDNSIGNARGVESDLNGFKVTDYTEYTGWWCKFKRGSNNLSYLCTQNKEIMSTAQTVWFEDFVPAVELFSESGNVDTELLSSEVYYNMLASSADMNYMIWEMEADNEWICDHSSLTKAHFDYETMTYSVDSEPSSYDQFTFKGQFDYMTDWFLSRSAWISEQWKDADAEGLLGDADCDGKISVKDATAIQKIVAKYTVENFSETLAEVDGDLKLTIKDATVIQKYSAKLEIAYPIGQPYAK